MLKSSRARQPSTDLIAARHSFNKFKFVKEPLNICPWPIMNSNYQQNIYKPQPSEADKRFWEWGRLRTLMIIFLVAVLTIFHATPSRVLVRTDASVCSPALVSCRPFMIIKKADNLQGKGSNLPPQQQLWLYEYVFTTSWPRIDLDPAPHFPGCHRSKEIPPDTCRPWIQFKAIEFQRCN